MTKADSWVFPHAKPIARGGKTLIMGIVNMTPDSFSGRNSARTPEAAAALAAEMLSSGADIIDIGAESSRPGAETLTSADELMRLGDVVERLRDRTDAPISIDTYHPKTAEAVLRQGADIINDITALRGGWAAGDASNRAMGEVVARYGAHIVLMHMPASPGEMQKNVAYFDVVEEVGDFLLSRAEFARGCGIGEGCIWVDPGFGFGKDFRHNRDLLLGLGSLADGGYPVLVGLSRKRMIDDVLHLPAEERLEGSLALAVIASLSGAEVVRVHDVKATYRALAVTDAVSGERDSWRGGHE